MKLHHCFAFLASMSVAAPSFSAHHANDYAGFSVTVKAYQGKATSSVSYEGQIARHLLHNALKSLAGSNIPSDERKQKMLEYFSGTAKGREILSPKGDALLQKNVDDVSGGKQLADKAYKGIVTGWPGNKTGAEVLEFMIDKAAKTEDGFDPATGLDYKQLISKLTMGAVFYHQAVDSYLTKGLSPDVKTNDKPYSDGAAYTGKEHVWDEAFGYFGAPAHTLSLSADDVYQIAKLTPEGVRLADANKDGKVDLVTEMAYGHAYYAAGFDKSGKTNYLHDITKAYVEGRKLIAAADGKKLTDAQYSQLNEYANTIKTQWEKVIAEAVFKYAGEVYQDLQKFNAAIKANGDVAPIFREYGEHWSELKGFALALQSGGKDLGETSVLLNRLIGFSPVLVGDTQITGIDADGNYTQSKSVSLEAYQLNMLKVQKLMVDQYAVKARSHDVLNNMEGLIKQIDSGASAEND